MRIFIRVTYTFSAQMRTYVHKYVRVSGSVQEQATERVMAAASEAQEGSAGNEVAALNVCHKTEARTSSFWRTVQGLGFRV
jgi:hypothetical protein